MFRPTMPEDAGMIFLFPQDIDGAFWMQNTLIPLSIAFVAADGRIVDDMSNPTPDMVLDRLKSFSSAGSPQKGS